MNFWIVWMLMVLTGFFLVLFYFFHYLVVLLSIEMMILGLLLGVSSYCLLSGQGVLFIFFLVVGVVMGGFGLSLLVGCSRGGGSDLFSLL